MASRLLRYIPYLAGHPNEVWLLPFFLLHLYAHTLLKVYALFTLTNVSLELLLAFVGNSARVITNLY